MKKIISALIAVILLIQSVAYSADEGVSNIKVVVKNDEVTVTADVDKIGKSYAMTVVKEGGSPKNSDDLFDMSETKSTENKQVQFTFSMPDERNGKKTDGRYIGYIKGKGGVKSEFSFEYATEQGRNEAMEAIVGATASQMLDYFEVSSQYRAGLASSGFDFYDYDNFSESEKREVCRLMEKNIDNGDADVIFSQSVLLSKINSADDIYEWIVKSNVKFNEVTHDKNTGNKFIEDIIVRERKYDSIEKFQSQYRIANILYECNNSRFATIGDNLRKYADELNLTSSDDYNRYIRLQGSDLNAVNDGIIIYLSKNPAKNTQGILSAINSGLSNVKDNNTYKSSGSSSRSEILGGAGSFANVQKPNDNAIDNTPIYTGTGFTDLDSVPWAESAIKSLYDKKIVSGTGNGLYEPQRNVRREEFVKMIVCAIGLNSESRETEFDDVGKGAWYEGYIATAVSNKIIEGIGNNLFGVGEYITRQDMAVIVERALNINEEVDAVFKFKDDSDISDYAKDAIYKLYAADIINGMENVYNPTALSTRAEAAVIINNMLNYLYQLNGADSVTNASPYKKIIDTLLGLGILEGISAEGFNEDGAIQRQVFVNAVVSMAVDGDLSDEQSIEYAKGVGLISNAEYDIHGYITYEEAAAALVNMLGYGKTYENKDPLSAAGELRLLKDVKSVTGEYAKSGDVIQMLYNALDIPVMKMLSITPGGETTLIVDRKQNILSACHGIEKVKGIVTSNEDTSLNAEASLSSGKVTIDGSIYDAGNSGAEKFLGFSTVAYIKFDDSGDGEILYIEEDRNNITELSAEMLEDVDLSDRVIMYCKTPTDKKSKKIKLSPVLHTSTCWQGKYMMMSLRFFSGL